MSDNNNLVLGETGLTQLATLIDGRITTKIASATSGFNTSVVESLPTTGTGGTIYFVPSSVSEDGNSYDEYIWVTSTSKFELIGSTQVEVPTKTSELTNDSGFLTEHQSLEGYALTTQIPTKTSDLTNDSNFSTYDPANKTTLNKLSESDDGKLLFDGSEIQSGGSTVTVTQTLTSGTEIGSVKVGDTTTKLYAPEGGNGGTSGDVYYGYEGYSEDETCIGEWLGKPLYRKLFPINKTASGKITYTLSEVLGYSSFSEVTVVKTEFGIHTSNNTVIDNYCINDSDQFMVIWNEPENALYIYSGTNWPKHPITGYLTIYFTKTTDAANSFTPSMVTANKAIISSAPNYDDYSTEEKCVGKWINKKPIYRKVIQLSSTLSISASGSTYTLDIDNIDELVKLRAFSSSDNKSSDIFSRVMSATETSAQIKSWVISGMTNIDYIILEYTKTTDAENSFTPSMITNDILIDEVDESDVADIISVLGGN